MRALLMLGCLRPRVALIDVVMPGLDGFALADRIAGLPELSPATLVLVADQRDEQVDRAAEQRGLLVPDKPLSIGEVGTALRRGGGHLPASAAGSRDRRRMVLGHRQNSAYLSRSCWRTVSRTAKDWVSDRMPAGRNSSEMIDQSSSTAAVDDTRRGPSAVRGGRGARSSCGRWAQLLRR